MNQNKLFHLLQDNENVLIVAARIGQADIVRDFISDFDLEDTDAVCLLEILIFRENWEIFFTTGLFYQFNILLLIVQAKIERK